MRKILILGGEPATGKTTLMREFIARLQEQGQPVNYGKLKALWFKQKQVFVLGIYDDQLFAGTDRLSMTVITDALKFLTHLNERPDMKHAAVVLEGDRLFNRTFIAACKAAAPTEIMALKVSEEEKHRRHVQRGDSQTASWLKSRKTKVDNLIAAFSDIVVSNNENEAQKNENLFSMLMHITPEGILSEQAQPQK